MHRFRFGIQLSGATSSKEWSSTATKLEDLGYSTMFIPDHFGDQFGPLVALTAAASATTTLRVGSLVFDNDYRHPLVLAKECATLDLLSEGRLEVGLGAGWMRTDYDESGIAYDEPALRVERLAEAVRVVKALFEHERVDFDGVHYQLRGAQGMPRPHTPGGPPLIIGGGSKGVLGLAAREAAIVGVNPSLRSGAVDSETIASAVPERYSERVAWIREAAGERVDEIELQSLVSVAEIGRPRREVADELSQLFGFDADEVAASPVALFGTEDEVVDQLCERREELGLSYWVLHEAEIDSFAPVVSRLAGT